MNPFSSPRDYIAFRWSNWLDYARYMARIHGFAGWENDLLNDIICDLLRKPDTKLNEMLDRKTRKTVNGAPTTELDKFVLAMLRQNAESKVAPFRKNTLGNKIISRANGKVETAHRVRLNGYDVEAGAYDDALNNTLDAMHERNKGRMAAHGYTARAFELYRRHYIEGEKMEAFNEADRLSIQKMKNLLTIKKTLLDD